MAKIVRGKSVKYVLSNHMDEWQITNLRNYTAYVQDCNKIVHLPKQDFPTAEDCVSYAEEELHISRDQFVEQPY